MTPIEAVDRPVEHAHHPTEAPVAKTPSPTETRLLRCHLSSLLQIKRLERRKDKNRSLCENYRNFDCKPRRISSSASLPPLHKSNYSHLLNDGNGRLRQPCTSDSTNSTPPKENMSTFVATHVFLLSSHMTMSPSDLRLQWTSVNCVCCSCKNSTQPTLPPDVFFLLRNCGFPSAGSFQQCSSPNLTRFEFFRFQIHTLTDFRKSFQNLLSQHNIMPNVQFRCLQLHLGSLTVYSSTLVTHYFTKPLLHLSQKSSSTMALYFCTDHLSRRDPTAHTILRSSSMLASSAKQWNKLLQSVTVLLPFVR